MKVRSNKELSFGALVDSGAPQEEIMRIKHIGTKAEYERILTSLREARKRAAEKQERAKWRN